MVTFAPLLPSVGGSLLALATSLNLSFFGRITGISGILNNAFVTPNPEKQWRYSFLSGLLSGGLVISAFRPEWIGPFSTSLPITALAGFSVGIGALMGNGCTSGHGLCGLPRFSIRSFAAIATFMISGSVAAILRTRIFPSEVLSTSIPIIPNASFIVGCCAALLAVLSLISKPQPKKTDDSSSQHEESIIDLLLSYATGLIFGIGLGVSGMCIPDKVINFLNFVDNWDPSLMFVMASGVLINALTFAKTLKTETPLLRRKFVVPTNKKIDLRLLLGGVFFGLGWGLAGLCPGPGIVGLAQGSYASVVYLCALLAGFKTVIILDGLNILPK